MHLVFKLHDFTAFYSIMWYNVNRRHDPLADCIKIDWLFYASTACSYTKTISRCRPHFFSPTNSMREQNARNGSATLLFFQIKNREIVILFQNTRNRGSLAFRRNFSSNVAQNFVNKYFNGHCRRVRLSCCCPEIWWSTAASFLTRRRNLFRLWRYTSPGTLSGLIQHIQRCSFGAHNNRWVVYVLPLSVASIKQFSAASSLLTICSLTSTQITRTKNNIRYSLIV